MGGRTIGKTIHDVLRSSFVIFQGAYTTKSDVWAFGVTLWEILTFAREQPYEALSDSQVIENMSELSESGSLLHRLPQPYNCPRDVFDLMAECWHKEGKDRPSWAEIQLQLVYNNLGYNFGNLIFVV